MKEHLMKKICLLLVLSSCFVTAHAQKKLFKQAIERGLTPNGSYVIENTKRSNVTAGEMLNYILDFEEVEWIKGEIIRRRQFFIPKESFPFLKLNSQVTTMEFVPGANVQFYILCHFFPGRVKRVEDLKIAVGYEIWREDIKTSTLVTISHRHDNIYWSGEVKDGLITGPGIGVYFNAKRNRYYVLSGNYKYGLPVGDNKRNSGYIKDYKYINFSEKTTNLETFDYGNITDGLKDYYVDEKEVRHDPIFEKSLQLVANDKYYIDSQKIEVAYSFVKNINSENYKNLNLEEDVVNSYVSYWSGKNFDPEGMIPLAKELSDVYTVIKALSVVVKNRYHLYSTIGVFWDHYDHDAILKSAVNIIKAGKEGSKYGFNNFYRQVEDNVVSKFNRFNDQINKEKAEVNQRIADEEKSHASYKEDMCENCKIDASKTTFPEGYVPSSSFLIFGKTPAHSEKDGKIVLKNGNYVSWKYVYDNGTYIEASGFNGYNRYISVAEMIEDILQDCKDRFCK